MARKFSHEELTELFERGLPFNRHLGMKVDHLGDGECVLRIPSAPELVGDIYRPALHGGVISTIADTSGGLAVFTRTSIDDRVSTLDMRVDYLRPGRVDVDLHARSRVIRMGNRVAVTDTVVYGDDPDQPVAKASAVYNVVRLRKG